MCCYSVFAYRFISAGQLEMEYGDRIRQDDEAKVYKLVFICLFLAISMYECAES